MGEFGRVLVSLNYCLLSLERGHFLFMQRRVPRGQEKDGNWPLKFARIPAPGRCAVPVHFTCQLGSGTQVFGQTPVQVFQ